MRRVAHAIRKVGLHNAAAATQRQQIGAVLVARASFAQSNVSLSTSPRPPRKAGARDPLPTPSLPPGLRAVLFDMLAQRLCSPTNPLPARGVYDVLANRSRIVAEFHYAKTPKRLSRQRVALAFLRRYNVLLHSLLFFSNNSQTWNITPEFHRLALLGESVLTNEVRGRLLKLFPDMAYTTLVQILQHLLAEKGLCAAFDRFHLTEVVGAKPSIARQLRSITAEQKCHMLCAVIGEMYWFVARTRPTDRTHNNALFPPSDVLILNVLCSHLLECIPAELIYHIVEPVVAEMKGVWVNEPMSLPAQLRLTPRTIGALSLNTVPLPRPAPTAATNAGDAQTTASITHAHKSAQSVRRTLTTTPDARFVKSFMRPQCNHRNFDHPRYQVLESDTVREVCALSSTKEIAANRGTEGALDSEAARVARVMELAKLALHQ